MYYDEIDAIELIESIVRQDGALVAGGKLDEFPEEVCGRGHVSVFAVGQVVMAFAEKDDVEKMIPGVCGIRVARFM